MATDPTTTERLMDIRLAVQAARDDLVQESTWPGLSSASGRIEDLCDAIDGLDEVMQHGGAIPVQWAHGR